MSTVPELPRAIVCHIAGFCNVADLPSIARTCRLWSDVPNDPLVCSALYFRFFGSPTWHRDQPWPARLMRAVAEQREAASDLARLCWLLRNGHSSGAKLFLEHESRDDLLNPEGTDDTPLLVAVAANSVEDVDALLMAGARVNARNRDGRTSLHTAAWHGLADMTAAMLVRGADPLQREMHYGQTAMHVAAARGSCEVMTVLHDACPQLSTLADRDGWLPLHVAVRRNHRAAVNMLVSWTSH